MQRTDGLPDVTVPDDGGDVRLGCSLRDRQNVDAVPGECREHQPGETGPLPHIVADNREHRRTVSRIDTADVAARELPLEYLLNGLHRCFGITIRDDRAQTLL